ncbi:ABC transporter permease [Poseidonocella sp. HB161398]|uniref:ABC transporter permease n=1 Tax=Poseidonocella sp. HB161398 TaxID=2320855 RepID=UPI001107CF66|nr:ABC transporter permease [Poseidonocella sp. HB161398]
MPADHAANPPAPVFSPRVAHWLRYRSQYLIPAVVLIAVWWLSVAIFDVPGYVLPDPASVVRALVNGLASGDYVEAAAATTSSILGGFAAGTAIGMTLAIVMVLWPVLDRLVFPYIVALQSMPKIAIAPLMIVWFGFGYGAKVAIVAMVAAFPVLVNMLAGLRATEHERIELMRALAASRVQILTQVLIPSALPYLFAGLSAALVLSVTGAIVGEFVGARKGIGVLILQANYALDLASVFALLLLLGGISAVLNLLLRMAGARVVFWTHRKR